MTSQVTHSIGGGWRGKYFYALDGSAHGWEAVFVESNGIIEGNILDDGYLGEANAGGVFRYPFVRFTKLYRTKGMLPVQYEGTMSEDGKMMTGRWSIKGKTDLTAPKPEPSPAHGLPRAVTKRVSCRSRSAWKMRKCCRRKNLYVRSLPQEDYPVESATG